jgi:hypothetical protein
VGRKRLEGYRAWLVRWDWAGEHARVDREVIAVLPPQTSAAEVAKFIERYYSASAYQPDEMLQFMRVPDANPYRARFGTVTAILEDGTATQVRWDGDVFCGHNPFIVASRVHDLKASPVADGSRLTWEEAPRPVVDLQRKRNVQVRTS